MCIILFFFGLLGATVHGLGAARRSITGQGADKGGLLRDCMIGFFFFFGSSCLRDGDAEVTGMDGEGEFSFSHSWGKWDRPSSSSFFFNFFPFGGPLWISVSITRYVHTGLRPLREDTHGPNTIYVTRSHTQEGSIVTMSCRAGVAGGAGGRQCLSARPFTCSRPRLS